MLRDADLRDRDRDHDTMPHQQHQQYDAPTSHHRQPYSSQSHSQSQSHQREYHYSRRRRDDAGGPSPPSSSSHHHTYAPAPSQGQSQAQAPYAYTRATSSSPSPPPPPAPRLQQASSSSSGSHVYYQPHSHSHSQQQQPPPPQLYHPGTTTNTYSRDRDRDRYRDRDLDRDLVSPLSSSPSPARSRTGTPPVPVSGSMPVPSPFDATPALSSGDSNLSLAVNYIPSKFSNPRLSALTTSSVGDHDGNNGPRRRRTSRRPENELGPGVPKMGGGVDAFRSGEARIGGSGDEDEDDDGGGGDDGEADEGGGRERRGWFAYSRSKAGMRGAGAGVHGHAHAKPRKARWNGFKWCLFIANLALTLYSFTALIFCLLTWFNVWAHADVIRAGNHSELVLSTLAAALGILTALIGWVGILMNNRSFLAVWTFLLWAVFLFVLVPGYLTYKRRTFNLEGKINAQWSKALGESGRLRIQNQLQCCGYFSPYVEATISQTCYSRSTLPGCKARYLQFERRILEVWYAVAFGLVPLHVGVMVAGLLCANHVTYRFGKGMMPKAYRLSGASMAVIMDNYASQLAERYGADVAQDVLTRSRSNLNLLLPAHPGLPAVQSTTSLKTDKAVAGSVIEYEPEGVVPSLGWRGGEREKERGRPPILRRGDASGSGSGTSREGENAPLI